ncbi:hypothetical protein Tco_0261897 [Tanacetum coccineum]
MEAGNKTSIKSGLAAKGKNIDGKLVDKMLPVNSLMLLMIVNAANYKFVLSRNVTTVTCSVSHLDEEFVKRLSSHYKEPTELEMQKMVNILVSGKAYDEVFNHLDMLHAPLEGKSNLSIGKLGLEVLIYGL